MASEDRVKLLWDCANALSAETHTNKLLKSYYINTCRKLVRDNIQVPKEKFAVSQMCPRCSVFWSENEFSLRLKPQAVVKNGKAKKLIAKLDESLTTQTKGILSKKQRRRAKWLKKRVCSTVEIRCDNCQHKSLVPLQKPQKKQKTETVDAAVATIETATLAKSKKKKSKKKDPTAGLIIKPITPKDITTTIDTAPLAKSKKKKSKKDDPTPGLIIKQITPKDITTATVKQETKLKVPASNDKKEPKVSQANSSSHKAKAKPTPQVNATAKQPKPNLSQPLKAKKKKKYSNNSNNKATTPHTPAVKSKTQQKNSLLQLAALLKKQQGSHPKTQQSRLDALLE